jgi:hypothetical protein
MDIHAKACRLALHGVLLHNFGDKNYAQDLGKLKIFKQKRKEGIVERMQDEYTVIVHSLFKVLLKVVDIIYQPFLYKKTNPCRCCQDFCSHKMLNNFLSIHEAIVRCISFNIINVNNAVSSPKATFLKRIILRPCFKLRFWSTLKPSFSYFKTSFSRGSSV